MSVILLRCDNVGQRMMLGFGGVLAAGLAIVASFGFCSAVGVAFVSIVGVVPFLVIGVYSVADPEVIQGVCSNPLLSPYYFFFHGEF